MEGTRSLDDWMKNLNKSTTPPFKNSSFGEYAKKLFNVPVPLRTVTIVFVKAIKSEEYILSIPYLKDESKKKEKEK